MNIQINVYASPWNQQTCLDALAFSQAAVASGHQLVRVFFFMDGVYNGIRSQAPATDEPDILAQWQSLKQNAQCELLLCVAASANRGLLSAAEAKRQLKDTATVAEGFELVGLGQWALGYGECDRVVSFR
ncbi:MAG: sulfurtransferase complex subunit TusD [Saccharospirillum sp.]|nr:sulfurtransferase complex subunit TusD [Saccharospirillum sp.]